MRIARLCIATLALTSSTLVWGAGPAEAHLNSCSALTGRMYLSDRVTGPLLLVPRKMFTFAVVFDNGTCTDSTPPPNLEGYLAGVCELADGEGQLASGHHTFTASWRPGRLDLAGGPGQVNGTINVTPDLTLGQACNASVGVDRLLVTGGNFTVAP